MMRRDLAMVAGKGAGAGAGMEAGRAMAAGRQDDSRAAPFALALVSGLCLGLAIAVNGVLAFLAYRYLGG